CICALTMCDVFPVFPHDQCNHHYLSSNHVLLNPADLTVYFLDWQRSRRRRRVAWRQRCRDLAALEATVAYNLATFRERLVCLRAYLRKSQASDGLRQPSLRSVALSVGRLASRLVHQRRIRELRRVPVLNHAQG